MAKKRLEGDTVHLVTLRWNRDEFLVSGLSITASNCLTSFVCLKDVLLRSALAPSILRPKRLGLLDSSLIIRSTQLEMVKSMNNL